MKYVIRYVISFALSLFFLTAVSHADSFVYSANGELQGEIVKLYNSPIVEGGNIIQPAEFVDSRNNKLSNGEVSVYTSEIVDKKGNIIQNTIYFKPLNNANILPTREKNCVYDGKEYSHGSVIYINGRKYTCMNGQWSDLFQ